METDILGKMSAETETGDKCHSVDVKGANPGNPVFTCNQSSSSSSRDFVPESQTREIRSKKQHPMYTTSSGTYGSMHATVETVPHTFHGRVQKFSKHLRNSGMYRNHSLNTSSDKSLV